MHNLYFLIDVFFESGISIDGEWCKSSRDVTNYQQQQTQPRIMITCPDPLCITTFTNENERLLHMSNQNHQYAKNQKGMDKALTYYIDQKNIRIDTCTQETLNSQKIIVENSDSQDFFSFHKKGWARKQRKSVRFSKKQKDFISKLFYEGSSTNNKLSAEQMATQMKNFKENEAFYFSPDEYLMPSQIRGLLTKLTLLSKGKNPSKRSARYEEDGLLEDVDMIVNALLMPESENE